MLDGLWSERSESCGAEVGAGAPHPVADAAVEDIGVPASRNDRLVCRGPDSQDHLGILSEPPRQGSRRLPGIASGTRQRMRAIGSLKYPDCGWGMPAVALRLPARVFRALGLSGVSRGPPCPDRASCSSSGWFRNSVARRGQQGMLEEGLADAQPSQAACRRRLAAPSVGVGVRSAGSQPARRPHREPRAAMY
jgi:hypothetical protein